MKIGVVFSIIAFGGVGIHRRPIRAAGGDCVLESAPRTDLGAVPDTATRAIRAGIGPRSRLAPAERVT